MSKESQEHEKTPKPSENKIGVGIALGAGVGAALGLAIGAALSKQSAE